MSKLNKLRGESNTAAIFSNNVDAPTASIFARMRGEKTAPPQFAERKKYTPSRFKCGKGETKSLIILDEIFTFAMREHVLKTREGKYTTERCIADWDSCPLCALPDNKASDVMLLTVLDLTPWEKDGKSFELTKRVLALKKAVYQNIISIASTQNNNLRGVMLDMTRGFGEKEPASGQPVFVRKLNEDELVEMFGTPEKVYESGFVLPANNVIKVFDYESIYTTPTRDELATKIGAPPRPGSKAEAIDDKPPWDEEVVNTVNLSEEYPDVD